MAYWIFAAVSFGIFLVGAFAALMLINDLIKGRIEVAGTITGKELLKSTDSDGGDVTTRLIFFRPECRPEGSDSDGQETFIVSKRMYHRIN